MSIASQMRPYSTAFQNETVRSELSNKSSRSLKVKQRKSKHGYTTADRVAALFQSAILKKISILEHTKPLRYPLTAKTIRATTKIYGLNSFALKKVTSEQST